MSKYISFSLWGDSALYCDNAILNVITAKKIYPDWRCLFFVASDCPALSVLEKMDCDIVKMQPTKGIDRSDEKWVWQSQHIGMFWRYYIIDDLKKDDVVIFRDADSLISNREAKVVNHWLSSPYAAHRIAECKEHWNSFMMGGMWGIKGGYLEGIQDSIEDWIDYYKTLNHPWIFVDLEYNTNVLGPIIGNKTIGYGYGHPNPLPPLKEGELFIGEVVDGYKRGQKYRLP